MKAAFYGSFTLSLYPYFTSHKPHYEKEVPFEIPKSWEWVRISDIGLLKAGSFIKAQDIKSEKSKDLFPCYGGNGLRGYVDIYNYEGIYSLIGRQGALCGNINLVEGKFYATEHAVTTTFWGGIDLYWMFYALKALNLNQYAIGAAQPGLSVEKINNIYCPLPPRSEQKRISSKIKSLFVLIERMDDNLLSLDQLIDQAKSKIVDLAIRGKLVPQDPNDEPASVLLERIKKKTHKTTTDKSHYPFEAPDSWEWIELNSVLEYEHPTKYIVKSTEYSDTYSIPVLTAGKSFIIGHTDEKEGVYKDLPVIIFDDFTTSSKYVDFEFKVKSSAMKILRARKDIANIKYIAFFMSITRLAGNTHKRYWISEYSKIKIPLPPLAEQQRIVEKIEDTFKTLDRILDSLKAIN